MSVYRRKHAAHDRSFSLWGGAMKIQLGIRKTAAAVLAGILLSSAAAFPAFAEGTVQEDVKTAAVLSGEEADREDPLWYRALQKEEEALVGDSAEGITHDSRFSEGYERHYGIDVSRYDRTINWTKVKNSGVEFAIIRMGYRTSGGGQILEDPMGKENLKGALNAGLRVGVYIFSQALNEAEAREEADWLLDSVSGYESRITIPYVMDYEYTGNGAGRLYRAKLSKSRASANVNAFLSEMKRNGQETMLYANTNFLREQLDVSQIDSDCQYWVARYAQAANYSGPYTYWQYSETGSVSGVPTNCDLDVWYEYTGTAQKNTGTRSSEENQQKTVSEQAMYRLYNPNSGEHFYTASARERDVLAEAGWKKEGTAWTVPTTGLPVYRLYNANAGDHHYTLSSNERDYLVEQGWKSEGIGWYALASGGTPVYRLYNPNAVGAGAHHYTISAGERDNLVEQGWKSEGTGWYAV